MASAPLPMQRKLVFSYPFIIHEIVLKSTVFFISRGHPDKGLYPSKTEGHSLHFPYPLCM